MLHSSQLDLRVGIDKHFLAEKDMTSHDTPQADHGVSQGVNEAWKAKRLEWAHAMWDDRGASST